MTARSRSLLMILLSVLAAAGCGYRFVDAYGGEGFSLGEIRNASDEPMLSRTMEEALARVAGVRSDRGGRMVSVAITRFTEEVNSVSASGEPVRQKISLEFQWRVAGSVEEGGRHRGDEKVTRTYLWSADPVTLDWNRQAAIRLLAEDAALIVSDRLEDLM